MTGDDIGGERRDGSGGKDIPPWLQPVPIEETSAENGPSKKLLFAGIAAAIVILGLFVAVILYLYEGSGQQDPLYVQAPTQTLKEKPADPRGMDVKHRDKSIYEQGEGLQPRSEVELGPQAEIPIAKIPDDPVGDAIEALEENTPSVDEKTSEPPSAKTKNSKSAKDKQPETTGEGLKTTPAESDLKVTDEKAKDTLAYRVQLGAYASKKSAARAWRSAKGKFRTVLGEKTPDYEAVQTADRTLYRLRVGPYATRAAADQVCLVLRAEAQACIVVNP